MGIDCGKDGLTVVACLKDVSVLLASVYDWVHWLKYKVVSAG